MLLQNDHNICPHLMFLISCRDIQVSLINKWFAQGKEFSNWSYWILILSYLLGSKSLKMFAFENEQHTFWSWKNHLINTAVTCHVLESFSKLEIMVVGKFCLILMGKLGCIVLYSLHAIVRTHSSTRAAGLMRVCVFIFFHREDFFRLQHVAGILEGTDQRSCFVNISWVLYVKFHHLRIWKCHISPPKTKTPAEPVMERKRCDIMCSTKRWYIFM